MTKSETLPRIRITPEMKTKLERLALEDGRTLSDYVRRVLELHLRSVECLKELARSTKGACIEGQAWLESGEIDKMPRPSVAWIPDIESPKVVID